MTSRAVRLSQWIERLRREHSQAERSWLRQGRLEQGWVAGVRQLLSDEGAELLEDAKRERVWSADELRAVFEQRAWLAFQAELAPAAALTSELAQTPFALPFGREQPAALASGLLGDGSLEGREHRAAALADACEQLVPRLLELRSRALEAQTHALPAAEPQSSAPLTASDPRAAAD
ncbi:MAG TPA: hypothetical protein VJR89_23570, partial [Polyangiales bacterium]|nr:hypothetical protein [Polyangiales bacterium]